MLHLNLLMSVRRFSIEVAAMAECSFVVVVAVVIIIVCIFDAFVILFYFPMISNEKQNKKHKHTITTSGMHGITYSKTIITLEKSKQADKERAKVNIKIKN